MAQQVRVVAVGHVDHGKSTLIGRLLNDTDNLPDGKVAEMRAVAQRRGVPFEWSFVLDSMQSERDQAVTIDTTRIWLRTPERDVVLIDAPGHKEFLRNMVTGASDADAALLLVDANDGVSEQTRRHALLLELIGVRHVVVAINKMDLVAYDAARYREIVTELGDLLGRIGIVATHHVPISARSGENVTQLARATMPWYAGPTVLAAILALPVRDVARGTAFRLAVQGTIRRDLQRIVVGRVEAGSIAVGDDVTIAPSLRRARIASIDVWPPDGRTVAHAGQSIGITLEGQHFVDRGDVVANVENPPSLATSFRARLLWLGTRALDVGDEFRIRFGTRTTSVRVKAFERIVHVDELASGAATRAATNDVAEVVFESREPLAIDTVAVHPGLARFILLDGIDIVAGGTILATVDAARNLVPVDHLLDRGARARRNGHRGAVVWLTGLPASGKSSIAMELERRLFERGLQTYVLDGDNLRSGLNADLGFSLADRSENIRRVAEVASLFADAGTIAIAAFVSPTADDRERARAIAGDAFFEVYVEASAAVCEARDPKGHYRRARAGDISGFTGIDGTYEPPTRPDLTLDTQRLSRDDAVDALHRFVDERIVEPARSYINANV